MTFQCTVPVFLKEMSKRRYISELLDVRQLLEESDRKLFQKIPGGDSHMKQTGMLDDHRSPTAAILYTLCYHE